MIDAGRRASAVPFACWSHLAAGLVDGHPALPVRDPADPAGAPIYFVLLEWTDGRVGAIRDFRYAR